MVPQRLHYRVDPVPETGYPPAIRGLHYGESESGLGSSRCARAQRSRIPKKESSRGSRRAGC